MYFRDERYSQGIETHLDEIGCNGSVRVVDEVDAVCRHAGIERGGQCHKLDTHRLRCETDIDL